MSVRLFRTVLRHLHEPPGPDGTAAPTDGDLLRRFAQSRDALALDALVRRHGPMVWGVCRRALRNHADAEDAYQITFAVLASRAGAIRNPNAVGGWLHAVANRVARRVRSRAGRDGGDEGLFSVAGPADEPGRALTIREFLAALDEELSRLPESTEVRSCCATCRSGPRTRRRDNSACRSAR